MIDNLKMIKNCRHMVKFAASELCTSYNEICGGECDEAVLAVLDGVLRIAQRLSQLEKLNQ